jgi:hypothetical protein
MTLKHIHRAVAAAACLTIAAPAFAQLVTDTVPRQRTIPVQQEVEQAMAEAPWHFGAIRLQPKIGVSNFGYVDNVLGTSEEEAVDDYTATVRAGVNAYLPFGAKGAIKSSILPEYTWYQDLDYRRHFGGYYDVSAYGFFNRMTLEATAFTADTQTIVSSERETQAVLDADGFTGKVELEIFRRLSIFGGADVRNFAYEDPEELDDPELEFSRLDRRDSAVRAGVRYRWSSFLDVSVLSETTETEFDVTPLERDNESEAVLVGLHYDRPKFFVNLTGGTRDGKPLNGSSFPEYSETTGSWFAEYRLTAPIDVQGFGSRDVVYGLSSGNPYFLEDRIGAAIRFQLGRLLSVRVGTESGENDYPLPVMSSGALIDRVDDVSTQSASLSIPLLRNLALTFGASQSDYDSNIPGYDRSVLRWTSTIGLRREIFR